MIDGEESDQQILDDIDQIILKSASEDETQKFESLTYILEKAQDELELKFILDEKMRLEKQLMVVSKKLSASIIEKEQAYGEELKRVMEIQVKLSDTVDVCRQARNSFEKSRKNFTRASLGIVASYRRREGLRDVMKSLSTIKTLQQTNERIREMIEEDGNYCGAIQLCLECQKVVNTLKHYKCVGDISSKIQELLELIEEHIDASLSKMCHYFNYDTYASLQKAYRLMGKTQTSMDSLCMHFATAISDKAFSVVHGYVELCSRPENKRTENYRKKDYKELCKHIPSECFVPCLNDLCKSLFSILLNYKRILYHHLHLSDSENNLNVPNEQVDNLYDQRFIQKKLEHGLIRVWEEVVQKLRLFLQSHDISSWSIEELMTTLKIARRMMDIGYEFCESKSSKLEEILHTKTVNYFSHYHKQRLDELRMYLENEAWTVVPVKSSFNYLDYQEFKFLKPLKSKNCSFSSFTSSEEDAAYKGTNFFSESLLKGSDESSDPAFENIFQDNEDVSDSILRELEKSGQKNGPNGDTSEDEADDEFSYDGFDKNGSDMVNIYSNGPLVTTTSLYVLRLIGKYMQIMFLLRQIAFDILLKISEIKSNCITNRLKTCVTRIETSLVESEKVSINDHSSSPMRPVILLDCSNHDSSYGLTERIIGLESVIFLASQLDALKHFFRDLIPQSNHSDLDQYYESTVSIASDLRSPGYMLVAAKSLDFDAILLLMEGIKWDLEDIPSVHNIYVDKLLKELQSFSERLNQRFEQLQIKLPSDGQEILWVSVLKLVNRTFIEGFSLAKKCTPGGRALMQLDYQEFLTKAEKMTKVKPIPERELVEEYIKAYYLMDDALEQWILNRNEYTHRQLIALVHSLSSEKKAKSRLLGILDNKFGINQNSGIIHKNSQK